MANSELKKWAKENMRGLENILIPSFTPDLKELDEEGIRWDVRQSIKHGFFSTLCASEVGLTFEEAKKFVEIAADEGKGKICVSTTLLFNSLEENIAMAEHAQKVGCHTALLGYPTNYYPNSPDDVYRATRDICDAAPDLGMVLYAYHNPNFHRISPTLFPLNMLDRMAEINNVVGMKIGSGDPVFHMECFERCGDKILVNNPFPSFFPMMVKKFKQQWAGAILFEMFQSPEKRYMVDFFDCLLEGKYEMAMDMYKVFKPLMMVLEQVLMIGVYPWGLFKYIQWCVGGNGGLTRKPALKMSLGQMYGIKAGFMMTGITPREPDEEFFVGRVNYAKQKGI